MVSKFRLGSDALRTQRSFIA